MLTKVICARPNHSTISQERQWEKYKKWQRQCNGRGETFEEMCGWFISQEWKYIIGLAGGERLVCRFIIFELWEDTV